MAVVALSTCNKIVQGEALALCKQLEDNSVDLVITSPPYFQQRSYTESNEEIGKESNVDDYIAKLLGLFRECLRATKPTGSLVFNLGDKYQDGNLLLVPYRFALAAREHAALINSITWAKVNPTPRQYQRRMVSSTEPFFHFAKTNKYYYNTACEISQTKSGDKIGQGYYQQIKESDLTHEQKERAYQELSEVIAESRAGTIPGFRMKILGKHRLPFGGQEGGRKTQMLTKGFTIIKLRGRAMQKDLIESPVETIPGMSHPAIYPISVVEKFINLLTEENDVILDPFMGSGTTAIACKKLNRRYLGFELCQNFIDLANKRICQ